MREWLTGMSTRTSPSTRSAPHSTRTRFSGGPTCSSAVVLIGRRGHRDHDDLALVQDDRAALAVGQEREERSGVVHPLLRPHGPGVRLRRRRQEHPPAQHAPVGAEHLRRAQQPGDLEPVCVRRAELLPLARRHVTLPRGLSGPASAPRNAAGPGHLPGEASQQDDLARRGPPARDQPAQLREDPVRARGVEVADLEQRPPQLVHRLLDVARRRPRLRGRRSRQEGRHPPGRPGAARTPGGARPGRG